MLKSIASSNIMEIVGSAEQFSLQENQLFCIQLDYEGIVLLLIQAGVITQEQGVQIEKEFVDNAGRMKELISRLIKLNSETSFDAFREAVKDVGEILLAQKLLRDQSSFGSPLQTRNAHPCLFNYDALNKIFSYLTQPDLSIARLVCQRWNVVIAECHIQKFLATFRRKSGHKQMIEFVSTGPKSIFCKHLTRFTLHIQTVLTGTWVFYKSFFTEFGSKIQALQLSWTLDKDLLALIFSLEIQRYLCNLRHLELEYTEGKELIPNNSLIFLSGLETLALGEPMNCTYFLEKFLETDHKLKALRLFICASNNREVFPNGNTILSNILKSPNLENIIIDGYNCHLDDVALGLMTFPSYGGRLKVFECFLKNVSPGVFRDFISSHRQTLHRLSINMHSCANPLGLLAVLPRLEALTCLTITDGAREVPFLDSISKLVFCTQAPNLKSFEILKIGIQAISQPVPHFVHEGLQELRVFPNYTSTVEGMRQFMSHVPQCFPNLTEMAVTCLDGGVDWPVQLGQLQFQPGSVIKVSGKIHAEWKRVDN